MPVGRDLTWREIFNLQVKFKKRDPSINLPRYAKPWDSGMDIESAESAVLRPGEGKVLKTGLFPELPRGYEMQLRPRSGMSKKYPAYLNLGTIDNSYRGEIGLSVVNLSSDYMRIEKGDRIAQGVIKYVEQFEIIEADELSKTERGAGGFGSTGI